jgi:peptide/nickel transport system substrate-binding protein
MGKANIGLRSVVLVTGVALAAAACGGGSGGGTDTPKGGASGGQKGGTLTFLDSAKEFNHIDPQRNYTGEDLAFFGGYMHRSLTAYNLTPDGEKANGIVGDLATDTGKSSNGAKTWTFTLRDGVKFEDGSPITCADVKYGVSRVFATSVITDGPQYPVSQFDIPKDKEGNSVYKGPYDTTPANNVAAYDKAVQCSADNKTITFNLAKPVGDFNYTVTLLTFSPVPKAKDTGEKYDAKPLSSGPYKIQEYTKGTQMVLVRNENWDPKTDPYRPAYPDQIVVKFGLDTAVIDQRLQADAGPDQTALTAGDVIEPSSLATVFNDERFKSRRVNDLDPYVRYYAINVKRVPNVKHRQALIAAVNRAEIRTIAGGTYAGDYADGAIKPNLTKDYEPTGVFDGMYGDKIAPEGNIELAKKLIAEAGAPMPAIRFDYPQSATADKAAASVVASAKRAGINIKPNPIPKGGYYGIVQDENKAGELINAGWGPDWANASTVIPELFTPSGGFNLSQANDPDFNAKVDAAKAETDRDKQAEQWKALNKQAMQNAWILPTRFGRQQRLTGSKVGTGHGEANAPYFWAPYGSWPYAELYVKK